MSVNHTIKMSNIIQYIASRRHRYIRVPLFSKLKKNALSGGVSFKILTHRNPVMQE